MIEVRVKIRVRVRVRVRVRFGVSEQGHAEGARGSLVNKSVVARGPRDLEMLPRSTLEVGT
jgi:hypothetical protein